MFDIQRSQDIGVLPTRRGSAARTTSPRSGVEFNHPLLSDEDQARADRSAAALELTFRVPNHVTTVRDMLGISRVQEDLEALRQDLEGYKAQAAAARAETAAYKAQAEAAREETAAYKAQAEAAREELEGRLTTIKKAADDAQRAALAAESGMKSLKDEGGTKARLAKQGEVLGEAMLILTRLSLVTSDKEAILFCLRHLVKILTKEKRTEHAHYTRKVEAAINALKKLRQEPVDADPEVDVAKRLGQQGLKGEARAAAFVTMVNEHGARLQTYRNALEQAEGVLKGAEKALTDFQDQFGFQILDPLVQQLVEALDEVPEEIQDTLTPTPEADAEGQDETQVVIGGDADQEPPQPDSQGQGESDEDPTASVNDDDEGGT